MRRSMMSKSSLYSGVMGAFLSSILILSNDVRAGTDSGTCTLGDSLGEVLSLHDVKVTFSERDNGYAILVTSGNPVRKEVIRKMVFELLKEKSLQTHGETNGYGLDSQ